MPTEPKVVNGQTQPWTISDLAKDEHIEGYKINPSTNETVVTQSELTALSTMLDWELLSFRSFGNGFAASAFKSPSGEIVFSFRGTNAGADWLSNTSIATFTHALKISQFSAATDFVFDVMNVSGPACYDNKADMFAALNQDSNVSFTGHSLGGGLAQYMTYRTATVGDEDYGVQSVTFNAVGIGQTLYDINANVLNASKYNSVDHVNSSDIVGNVGFQLGRTEHHADNSAIDYSKVDFESIAKLLYARIQLSTGVISTIDANKIIQDIKTSIIVADDQYTYDDTMLAYNGYTNANQNNTSFVQYHMLDSFLVKDENTNWNYEMTPTTASQAAFSPALQKSLYQLIEAVTVVETAKSEGNYHKNSSQYSNSTFGLLADGVFYISPTSSGQFTYSNESIAFANSVIFKFERALQTGKLGEAYREFQQSIAANVQRIDPLILDLDGDGIETIHIDDSNAFFDLDLNGFAESTSWAHGDDGLLVLDRNSDGVINNGGELFGDRTLLDDGVTYASSGFDALAEFDDNLDNVIDSNDSIYNLLRIWQDVNNDGVSTASELKNLIDLGIVSIALSYLNTGITDSADNIQVRVGEFLRDDGSTGAMGEYLFNRDTANSIEESIDNLSEDIAILPNLQGSGNVSSLHKAMADDATGQLQDLVEQFIAEEGVVARNSLMVQILTKWTNSEAIDPASRGGNFDAQKLAIMEKFFGLEFAGSPNANAATLLSAAYTRLLEGMYVSLLSETHLKTTLESLQIDSSGNLAFNNTIVAIDDALSIDSASGVVLLNELSRILNYEGLKNTTEFADFRNHFATQSEEYAKAIDFTGAGIIVGTSSDEYFSANAANTAIDGGGGNDQIYANTTSNVALYGGAGDDSLYGSAGNDILNGGTGSDHLEGGAGNDTYMFARGDGLSYIYDSDAIASNLDSIVFANNVASEDVLVTRSGDNLELSIIGTDDKLIVEKYFSAYARSSWWYAQNVGEDGNKIELIKFADGTSWNIADIKEKARTTLGTAAGDSIGGFSDQDDIIDANSGDDTVWTGDGNDRIVGGEGNDYLQGGNGDDAYVFNLGDGHDTIYEDRGTDTIRFGEGINPTDVTVSRVTGSNGYSYDLELTITGTSDKVTVTRHFGAYQNYVGPVATPDQTIEKIVFADQTEWDLTVLYDKAHVITGTDGDDYIYGWDGSGFTIVSGNGNDYIAGSSGNDALSAGGGDDTISGGGGDDMLVGEVGNDYLQGGEDDDVYVFNIGDGQDTIYEGSGNDTIQFGAGINPADVKVARVPSTSGYEYNLEITIAGTDDKITVTQHFGAHQNYVGPVARPEQVIEKIEFADGTIWTQGDIYDIVHNVTGNGSDDNLYAWDNSSFTFSGENGNDSLSGGTGDDNLHGGAGNDSLSGGAGNDLLDSGTGDDYLQGGVDDDVYVFNIGDGQDTIYEGGGSDTIRFGTGVNPTDIHIARVPSTSGYEYNLEITIAGTTDKITVTQHFGAHQNYVGIVARPEQVIEKIEFADGTIWTQNDIYGIVHNVTGSEADDSLNAWDDSSFTFTGEGGNDYLSGASGNDTLRGGEGHDTLSGATGDDLLEGGAGDDYLQAGEGNDTYVFNVGDGQDTIYENGGTDKIKFGTGINPADVQVARVPSASGYEYNLEITIAGTNDKIIVTQHFGAHQNYVGTVARPEQVIESVEFADGTVWTQGDIYEMVHTVTGTDNGDSLSAWDDSAFTLRGDGGNDYLAGGNGNDALHGGTGNDSLYGSNGDDLLVGDAGDDSIVGGQGDDTYVFALGDGQDTISEEDGVDALQFAADITSADVAVRRVTADGGYSHNLELSVIGTGDKVTIYRYFGAYGNYSGNYATPQNVVENIVFADGTTWTQSDIYNAVHNVTGTGSDDSFYAWDNGNFTFQGLDGNDYLQGGAGDDVLNGGSGNDSLYASEGNDTLLGGVGSDTLSGGLGDDVYVFNRGDGNDMVSEDGGADTIQFGADINPADVIVERVSADNGYSYNLVLSIAGTDDKLTVYRYFGAYGNYSGNYTTPQNVVENFIFADGTIWNGAVIYDKVHNLTGTEGSDYFAAWGQDAFTYNGLAGDDTLQGNTGNDTLLGGDGNDQLYGSDGNDILDGGSDNDVLHGGQGNDTLVGAVGNDQLYGGEGNDILNSGTGNDILEGSTGDDTYVFGIGHGQDIIYDNDTAVGNVDIVNLLPGVAPEDVTVRRNGDSLELRIVGTSDILTIERYFSPYARGSYYTYDTNMNKIEEFRFADGTVWDTAAIQGKARFLLGTDSDDTISGYGDQQNIINAGEGNDTVYASYLGDKLYGEAGNDALYGSSGADVLDGGTGSDTLEGATGSDTYIFGRGYGSDTIYDSDATVGTIDTISFLEGVEPADLTVKRNGNDLRLTIAGTTDTLTIQQYFSAYTKNGYYTGGEDGNKIEQIQFTNGTVWDIAAIKEMARHIDGTEDSETLSGYSDQKNIIKAGAGNDTIYASYQGDDISGEAGSDTIYGSSGNDVITGGTGDDTLEGSYGNDTYVFGIGDGNDTIYDSDSTVGNVDTISFAIGIDPSDVVAIRNGDNLELRIANTTDKLTIERYFSAYPRQGYYSVGEDGNKIEQIQFADGTAWDIATIKEKVRYMSGTDNDDSLSGFSDQKNIISAGAGNDTVYASYRGDEIAGEAGNDTIYGSSGNDTIDGGTGDDLLEGNYGNDTYVFGRGYGSDTVYDSDSTVGNTDIVTFLEDVAPSDIEVKRNGDNLELTITGTTDKLTIERYFSAYPRYGYYPVGENGNKVEQFQFSDGTVWDIAAIKEKSKYITGTENDDYISGYGDQKNVIAAGAGNDTIYASYLGDEISGGAGNDTIHGSSGEDRLIGGTGNDAIDGATGNDSYVFALGDGQDVIYDNDNGQNSGLDVIEFGEGINASDVTARRLQNDDLELTIAGTDDKLTIERYFSSYYKNSSWNTGANSNKIEELRFADGTIWDIATVQDKVRYISGSAEADSISGFGDQKNIITGNAGDDTIYAASLGDELYGNAGNDTLNGSSGDDLLVGGTGNDRLEGNTGNDTYSFALGDGQDVIYDTSQGQSGFVDVVSFSEDISPTDVSVKRLANDDLELTIAGTDDKLTIERFFSSYYKNSSWNTGADSNAIEEFRFADGTVWNIATIKDKARYLSGTETSDSISGFGDQQNIITGEAGDDSIYAGSGLDNSLYGESGNDSLYGSSGNDRLDGGTGNDLLEGNTGNDTYVFGIGSGTDVIYDNDNGSGMSLDTVEFAAGISPTDIKAKRLSNDDLELTINGTADKLTIERFFSNYYKNSSWNTGVHSNTVEQFHFDDNTVWGIADIKNLVLAIDGTEASESLNGYEGNDTISALGGNDYIYASSGNDTLTGGSGDDYLYGDNGDDTYVFGAGDGSDTIYDYSGDNDKVLVGQDLSNLVFSYSGNDLKIAINGTDSDITVSSWNNNSAYQIETLQASDGSTLMNTQVTQLIQAMASFSSDNNGMSWSQALQDRPGDVQAILAQHWTAPTV
ncbi:Bifunctional hemolysin/adenylate cyclase precursor [compost metagenome]